MIQRRTVVSRVVEKIRELIASGQYVNGDKIPTEQFGIGRFSVREMDDQSC